MFWIALVLLVILLLMLFIGFFKARFTLLKYWIPATITGIFIVGILPITNNVYWMQRNKFEKSVHDRGKRCELIASTARTYTILFKTHTCLHQLAQERSQIEHEIGKFTTQKEASPDLFQIHASRLNALDTLRSDLMKERIKMEGQLGVISAMLINYFSDELVTEFSEVALLYDQCSSTPGHYLPVQKDPVVKKVYELISSMAKEAKKHEIK